LSGLARVNKKRRWGKGVGRHYVLRGRRESRLTQSEAKNGQSKKRSRGEGEKERVLCSLGCAPVGKRKVLVRGEGGGLSEEEKSCAEEKRKPVRESSPKKGGSGTIELLHSPGAP